jgi:hypothetical protein
MTRTFRGAGIPGAEKNANNYLALFAVIRQVIRKTRHAK